MGRKFRDDLLSLQPLKTGESEFMGKVSQRKLHKQIFGESKEYYMAGRAGRMSYKVMRMGHMWLPCQGQLRGQLEQSGAAEGRRERVVGS